MTGKYNKNIIIVKKINVGAALMQQDTIARAYSCMLVSQSLCILLSRSDNRVCVNDFPNRALVNEPNRWQVETNVKIIYIFKGVNQEEKHVANTFEHFVGG